MRKYSHQAVLAFDKSASTSLEGMQATLSQEQGENVPVIYHDRVNENEQRQQLSHLDHHSRLYISAHGTNNPEYAHQIRNLGSQPARDRSTQAIQSWEPIELANMLEKTLPQAVIGSTNTESFFDGRLCISLIICFAGMPREASHLNSFAAKLQAELANRNIFVDIKARITIVGKTPDNGKKTTIKIGHEDELDGILELKKTLKSQQKEIRTNADNYQPLMNSLEKLRQVLRREDELCIRQQPGSKILFKWVSENNRLTQVAYDAYELKKHEEDYSNIKAITQELRTYADEREKSPDHQKAVSQARTLATNIEKEANNYFNGADKTSARTQQFKQVCFDHIRKENHELGRHRHSLFKRIVGKLALGVTSVLGLSSPYFIHRHLIKKGYFSTGLFSNKTRGKKIADQLSDSVNNIQPVKRFK